MCLEVLASILSFLDINDHEDYFSNVALLNSLGLSKPESTQVLSFWLCNTIFTITHELGKTSWTRNSKLHRTKGPAVDELFITFDSVRKQKWMRKGDLHRSGDLPAIEWDYGLKEWWWKGRRHRNNNPARISDFCETWFFHGKPHRTGGGPVYNWKDEEREWYMDMVNV